MNNALPSWDQVSGSFDRVLIALFALAVGKGWISQTDAANYIAILLAVGAGVYGLWVNRQKALVMSVANIPNTVVVTSKELATATPGQNNIVSNTDVKVQTK